MRHSGVLVIAIIVLLIGSLAVNVRVRTVSAQTDPAVATAVQQGLDATATAAAQFGITQTIEASFNQALTATATMYIPNNSAWTPMIQDFDDVTMVMVPPGCFMMGSTDGSSDEQPIKEQCFDDPFWIDQTEVTQAQFDALEGQAAEPSYFPGDNRPVELITWFEARDFCKLRGARLPTEAEWEYAARGPDALVYPWGNEWNENNAVWHRNSNEETADVGSLAVGISWVGALDMSGNVWEWVNTIYGVDTNDDYDFADNGERLYSYPYTSDDSREVDNEDTNFVRVVRGGSYGSGDYTAVWRSADRDWYYPGWGSVGIGFRCVRSA